MCRSSVETSNAYCFPTDGGHARWFPDVSGRARLGTSTACTSLSRDGPEAKQMGMMDWVEDDEDDSSTESSDDPTDDMDDFDDFEDDFDDFDDDFEDDFDDSSDDAGGSTGGGDEFDDFDDGFDDEFDDFDDGGGGGGGGSGGGGAGATSEQLADFEDRIGELETQVGSISSTMNTVREENKQIGETVDELDDTIRKLLDIYEMVTRGINPFVDDAKEMGGLEHGEGAFGLFDSEEEEEDNLSSEVVDADAEDFFDEDFGDLDPGQEEKQAEAAAGENLADEETDGPEMLEPESEAEETSNPATADAGSDSDSDSDGGGVSFDDLKAEYEDDGWDEADADVEDEGSADEGEAPAEAVVDEADTEEDAHDALEESDDASPAEAEEESDVEDEGSADEGEPSSDEDVDGVDSGPDVEVDTEGEAESDSPAEAASTGDPEEDTEAEADADESDATASETEPTGTAPIVGPAEAETDEAMFETDVSAADRPSAVGESTPDAARNQATGRERRGATRADHSRAHLAHLPPTYVAESVAMEWMRFLVSTGGLLGASRALRQYEEFGWISAEVRATLDTYARLVATPGDDSQQLSVEHHETSLSYVSRLGDRTPETETMRVLAADGGIHDGLRR